MLAMFMVDIHCHLLPGLDDGATSMDVSLEMARVAVEEGITHVVATPHAGAGFTFRPDAIKELRAELQARLGDSLTLLTGCDFHLNFENLQDIRRAPERFTINQKSYLLVEFADYSIPPGIDQELHNLQLAGLHPIITHPERNPLIRSQPERLYKWIRQGCYVQITAGALLGKFGERAKAAAELWLDENAVHFVASDAHNTTSRPFRLKEAYAAIASRKGEAVARALFTENPRAAVEGEPLPFVPLLPEDLGQAPGATPKRRKRFWFF
jgi:protein-tyrosine phosphatase